MKFLFSKKLYVFLTISLSILVYGCQNPDTNNNLNDNGTGNSGGSGTEQPGGDGSGNTGGDGDGNTGGGTEGPATCPEGYIFDSNNICVLIPPVTDSVCADGFIFNTVSQSCVLSPTIEPTPNSCLPGYKDNGAGCIFDTSIPAVDCEPGFIPTIIGTCVPASGTGGGTGSGSSSGSGSVECPDGYKADGIGGCTFDVSNPPSPSIPDGSSMSEYRPKDVISYANYDINGNYRSTGNNLSYGELTGRVQFIQSHTSEPNKNEQLYKPNIVAERDALLVFMPTDDTKDSVVSVQAKVYINGALMSDTSLNAPINFLRSNNSPTHNSEVIYSNNAWSTTLPWSVVKSGMSIEFTAKTSADTELEGGLSKDDIDIDYPVHAVAHFIRLGMLSPSTTDGTSDMLEDPARAMADYFQTVPLTTYTNATYDNVTLRRVMLSSGVIYDMDSPNINKRYSPTEGSTFGGDMRGDVGKSQVSVGVNLANTGYPSWNMSQSYHRNNYLVTVHLNQGRYLNYVKDPVTEQQVPVQVPEGNDWNLNDYTSIKRHGLSGGGGIMTLKSTTGNEFSHEMGHGYGLGHYVKPERSADYWMRHHADTGWAYDAYNNNMRANYSWTKNTNAEGAASRFLGIYNYIFDTMSGGTSDLGTGTITKYTFMTPYTAYLSQLYLLRSFPIAVDKSLSETGYVKWDLALQKYANYHAKNTYASYYGVYNSNPYMPYKKGIPVVTILGAYIPDHNGAEGNAAASADNDGNGVVDNNDRAVLYPGFVTNWGNVFHFPEPLSSGPAIWLEVNYANNTTKKIAVGAGRHNVMMPANQIHINIDASDKPVSAKLMLRKSTSETPVQLGETISLDYQRALDMPEAVVIGKEHGYKQAIEKDVEVLNDLAKDSDSRGVFDIPYINKFLINRVIEHNAIDQLTPEASLYVSNYITLSKGLTDTMSFVDDNRDLLIAKDSATVAQLLTILRESGMVGENEVPTAPTSDNYTTLTSVSSGKMLDASTDGLDGNATETPTSSNSWVYDLAGRLRPVSDFSQCVSTVSGTKLGTSTCENAYDSASSQIMRIEQHNGHYAVFQVLSGKAFDFSALNGHFFVNGFYGGNNQLLRISNTTPYSDKLFTIVPYDYLEVIYKAFE